MKIGASGLVLCFGLAACGDGTPFNGVVVSGGGTGSTTDTTIPADLANKLKSFSYNPTAQTLTITGINSDDSQFTATYRRRAALDRVGYQAYTAQDGSLDRHVTAYVKEINGTGATVVMTGGQYQQVFSGARYANGSYSAPVAPGSEAEGGLVTYAGTYVGLLNRAGSDEDLTPVAAGTPNDPRPVQAAEVTGKVLITGDFTNAAVDGLIYERRVADYNNTTNAYDPNSADPLQPDNLALESAAITTEGTFFGNVLQNTQSVGQYGGIFGGTGATEVAGVIHAENHVPSPSGTSGTTIEYGAFVLTQCGQPNEDPICNQPVR